mgnify:CR=1 FL=1
MDLKETDILGDSIADHWYYRAKAAAMMKLLPIRSPAVILDVGAGSDFFSRYLLTHTTASEAWCVDTSYDTDSEAAAAGKPLHYRRSLETAAADVVLLMDVLEHIDDDVGLLADYVGRVPKGARFLISVPAFQSLWSGHDVFLQHKRRYTLPALEDVIRRAGLQPQQSAYYFGLVFPIAVAARLLNQWCSSGHEAPRSQLKRHSPLVNGALGAICKVELPLLAINRLAGLTVFCLARRP